MLFGLLGLLLLIIVALGLFASSDRGSKWLLEFVLDRQQTITYQYEDGNLIQGIIIKDILVKVKDVVEKVATKVAGRLLVFFPGRYENNNFRLLDGYDGWDYHAFVITADKEL